MRKKINFVKNKNRMYKLLFLSFILLVISLLGMGISLVSFFEYFLLEDKVTLSLPKLLTFFSVPFCFFFSYLFFISARERKVRLNNKILVTLSVIMLSGILFSIPFSLYIDFHLTSLGYVKCHKKSFKSAGEYVKSKDMCK
ncbi:DUF1240 domain-containing protein [Providencia stuartii]|uniref:DUF1240 domain-containing protein n=1 Tax=Providencia stuartii TaxID=588 RepID=UPI003B63428A